MGDTVNSSRFSVKVTHSQSLVTHILTQLLFIRYNLKWKKFHLTADLKSSRAIILVCGLQFMQLYKGILEKLKLWRDSNPCHSILVKHYDRLNFKRGFFCAEESSQRESVQCFLVKTYKWHEESQILTEKRVWRLIHCALCRHIFSNVYQSACVWKHTTQLFIPHLNHLSDHLIFSVVFNL